MQENNLNFIDRKQFIQEILKDFGSEKKPITEHEADIFFEALWGEEPPEGYTIVCPFRKPNLLTYPFHTSQLKDISTQIEMHKSDKDVYFSIGLQKDEPTAGKRGKDSGVIAIPGFWCDFDFGTVGHKKTNYPPELSNITDILFKTFYEPSLIVFSGGGVHAYWLFKEPWVFENDIERQQAMSFSHKFQNIFVTLFNDFGWHLDNTSAISQLLRVPGTYNFKTGARKPVYILDQNENRYNPETFQEFFIEDTFLTQCQLENMPVADSETNTNDNVIETHHEPVDHSPVDSNAINHKILNELVSRCDFLQYCKNNAKTLSEPEWHAMICLLAHEYGGGKVIHQLSQPYPQYSKKETDLYIAKAIINSEAPLTCDHIRSKIWTCNRKCAVKSPIQLKENILKEFNISQSNKIETHTITENNESDDYNDLELLKERIPDLSFPWDSYPLILSDCIKDLGKEIAVLPEMPAVIALGIFSSAIGSKVIVKAKEGYSTFVNLWISIIAKSGEKKSPVSKRLMKPVYAFQNQLVKEYNQIYSEWKHNQKDKDEDNEPEPKLASLFTTDPTIEALIELLQDNKNGILLYQDEISNFLLSFNKYRKGSGGDRELYLMLWNGLIPLKKDRVSSKLYVEKPFFSILGGLQPRKTTKIFGDDSYDDGLISRFLFYKHNDIYIDLTHYTWRKENENLWTELIHILYTDERLKDLHLKLNETALNDFLTYVNSMGRLTQYFPEIFAIFARKAPEYVLRISGILHVIEFVLSHPPFAQNTEAQKQASQQNPFETNTIAPEPIISQYISADTLNRAIKLVNYFMSQARQIVELYGPQKTRLSLDQKGVLEAILSVHENRNSFELPNNEIHKEYNNNLPDEAKIYEPSSFGKILAKTLRELKITYQKKKLKIANKTPQGICLSKESIENIKKTLKG